MCLSKYDMVECHCEVVGNEVLSTEDAVLARKMTAHTHTYLGDKILVFTLSNAAC